MARPDNDNTSIRVLNMVGKKSFAVSLPIEIIRVLGWTKGEKLLVRRQSEKIVIERGDD